MHVEDLLQEILIFDKQIWNLPNTPAPMKDINIFPNIFTGDRVPSDELDPETMTGPERSGLFLNYCIVIIVTKQSQGDVELKLF